MSQDINPLTRFGLDENEPDHSNEDIAKWCMSNQCTICGKNHQSLIQARICCDIAPENEPIADKMKRLIGTELADLGIISRKSAVDAQVIGSIKTLSTLRNLNQSITKEMN